jgi:cytochrome c oxidase subunit II
MLSVWITIFLFCAVGGCLLYVLWRYRIRNEKEAMEVPPQTHGNSKVEMFLILASTVILVILAVPTLQGVVLMNKVPDANDEETLKKLNLDREQIDGAITVNVTGKRFFWIFEYPQFGIVTANELVFPVTKAIRINLKSEDVIHSFWLPKLAGKMDAMPGHENFMWFIADQEKILSRTDRDGNPVLEDTASAMPSVFDGKMRDAVFAKQEFNATFEPVGGLFYGQCAEFCGNSHAYMSFRGLAQTDADFAKWVERLQNAQNPNFQTPQWDSSQEYEIGSVVIAKDDSLTDENSTREFRAVKKATKGDEPSFASGAWEKLYSDDYEFGKSHFNESQCAQCHALNRTGIGSKGPNLTLFGLRTSLAAGWMRNDRNSLVEWLQNSDSVKFGNLMWNGEGVDENHGVRSFEPIPINETDSPQQKEDKEKLNKKNNIRVNQLVTYLLEQR